MHLPILTTLLLATPALTLPTSSTPLGTLPLSPRDAAAPQASNIIAQIMPSSTSCSGSPDAQYASDCRTAAQAAEPLITAMVTYNLYSSGQIAAVLALIGFESVDLKYKHNVYPGRPGQGTSAMMFPENVAKYAASIPELQGAVSAANGDVAKILDLVVDDKYNFGAAAWYLTSVCGKNVVDGLVGASDAGWTAYMTCVGVPDPNDAPRQAYWARAKKAFGLA